MTEIYTYNYSFIRSLFKKSIAGIYIIAFIILWNQFEALFGSSGLLPAKNYFEKIDFWQLPSIFHFDISDLFMKSAIILGFIISTFLITGFFEKMHPLFDFLSWIFLYVIYISFIHAGQQFYSFGWETLLLEVTILTAFLGVRSQPTPKPIIFLFLFLNFRLLIGAGLIKLRGDSCWTDLTCTFFHYETQPLPGPFSKLLHHMPEWFHKFEVLFTFFIELIVPFGIFLFSRARFIAGSLLILFQISLLISGNLTWLNVLTIIITFWVFDDSHFKKFPNVFPKKMGLLNTRNLIVTLFFLFSCYLAVTPILNLFSPKQIMNTSHNNFHYMNSYGMFGSITRERNEIIILGTTDTTVTESTQWLEYEFKSKPGNPASASPQVTPYHYKIDWQMWFAAMSNFQNNPWFINLMAKILKNDATAINTFFKNNPFPDQPPRYVKALLFKYKFADNFSDETWERTLIGLYFPIIELKDERLQKTLREMNW